MRSIAVRIVMAAVIAALSLAPWAPGRALAALVLAGALPGLCLIRTGGDRIGSGIALALSPHLFAATVLIGLATGAGAGAAAALGLAFWTIAYAGGGTAPSLRFRGSRPAWIAAAAIALAGLCWLGPALAGPGWRLAGDDGFNIAVASRISRAGLPVVDPWFTPLRPDVSFAWHALVAAVAAGTGAGVQTAAVIVNLVALAGFGAAFFGVSGLFVRRPWPRLLALVVALFAVTGGEGFGVASPSVLVPAPLCVLLGLVAAARMGWWGRRLAIAWTAVFPALILSDVPTGLLALAVTVGMLGFQHAIRAHPEKGGPEYATLLGLALAGSAVTIPYVVGAMPNGGPPLDVGWQGSGSFSWHLLGVMLLAAPFLRWQARRDQAATGGSELVTGRFYAGFSFAAAGMLCAWWLGVVVLALFVSVRGDAAFAWLLFLPVALFAAGGLERLWRTRGGRALAVLLVFMCVATPANVDVIEDAFSGGGRPEISEHERAVYHWIAQSSPEDAVFFEFDDMVRVPALARRDLYWGSQAGAHLRSYSTDELVARRRMRDAVCSDRGISMAQARTLRALGRRVFLVYRSRPDDLYDASQIFRDRPAYEGRFATPTVSVYEIQLSP